MSYNLHNFLLNSKDVNLFKISLGNYWYKYGMLYNYKAQPNL